MYCFELEFNNDKFCYIDVREKIVLALDNIPQIYFDIMTDVKTDLETSRVNLGKNYVIQLLSYNETRQKNLVANFLSAFTKTTGNIIKTAAVFDRNHLIMTALNSFTKMQRFFMCTLKPEQYKGLKDFEFSEDFKLLKKYDPYSNVSLFSSEPEPANDILEWVAEARYGLLNRARNVTRVARVALVVKFVNKKANIIPVITNLSLEKEPDIAKVAMKYFKTANYKSNVFANLSDSLKFDEKITPDIVVASKGRFKRVLDTQGKKGVSIRPAQDNESVVPPFSGVRTMADDVGKKTPK